MKKPLLLCLLLASAASPVVGQNVGIGTTSPKARLHVSDSAVLFTGPFTLPTLPGNPPVSGAGTRMMWYPNKSAFRAGTVSIDEWDRLSVGNYSAAFGKDNIAEGNASFASGFTNKALGVAAMALGEHTISSGYGSSTSGFYSNASGNFATAMGALTVAKAAASLAIGSFNDDTDNPSPSASDATDRVFQIGNGSGTGRSNAMTTLRNGNTGLGTTTPLARLHVLDSAVLFTGPATLPAAAGNPPVSGAGTRMMWYPNKGAFRAGNVFDTEWDRTSTGNYSAAFGKENTASGVSSFAAGNATKALAATATSFGDHTTASGNGATALGFYANASGNFSTASGVFAVAKASAGVSLGTFNDVADNPDPVTEAPTDRLFQIGNGTSLAKKNAITILRNGNTGFGLVEPAAKIDISKGRIRFTGNPNVGTAQGIEFTNAAGTANNGFVGTYNDSTMGFYGYTGAYWKMLFNNTNGNLGLQGNSNPRAALSFANTVGNKIALWGNADSDHYGLGIQGGKLQIYGSGTNADIVLGYGRSDAFTENMIVKGTGNVGIGTSSPSEKLQVAGNARITGTIQIEGGNPSPERVLTSTDGVGNTAWQLPMQVRSAFEAHLDFTPAFGSVNYTVPFVDYVVPNTVYSGVDIGSNFSSATHAYTVPSDGTYEFTTHLALQQHFAIGVLTYRLQYNVFRGGPVVHYKRWYARTEIGQLTPYSMDGTAQMQLKAGDVVEVTFAPVSAAPGDLPIYSNNADHESYFSGRRLY